MPAAALESVLENAACTHSEMFYVVSRKLVIRLHGMTEVFDSCESHDGCDTIPCRLSLLSNVVKN